jgi:hypothetical protein
MKKVRTWPQSEEVPVSFSEPGRDDGGLPPVNIVIPDDARELDREVLAYRRELRAKRRRQRFLRLFRPFHAGEFTGHAAIVPLIAACLAITLVGGALLSVATMTPASAPTVSASQAAASPTVASPTTVSPAGTRELPAGTVQVNGHAVPARSLVNSVIAIIPAYCDCGTALSRIATEAWYADVNLYFAGTGAAIYQLPSLLSYGNGAAVAVADNNGVLSDAYHPTGLTVLLVSRDADAEIFRNLPANFQLTSALQALKPSADSSGTP